MRDDFRIEVQDFTDRVNAEWAAASPEDVDAMNERTKRLSKELADNYVDETLEAHDVDQTPGRWGARASALEGKSLPRH
jgi:hypothetical protein